MGTRFERLPHLRRLLHHPLIRIGDTPVTAWGLIHALLVLVALLWVARRVQHWVSDGALRGHRLDPSARHAAGTLARYTLLVMMDERFRADGIEFPFPQRDLHIKSGVLEVRHAAPRID